MTISIQQVDNMVEEEGELVRHQIGMRCFCHGRDGQPDPNCTAHEMGGWLYVDEAEITGTVTDISQRRELMETGVFMPGDCVFSPLTTERPVSEGDKIIFTWPLPHGHGDPLIRGDQAGDTLTYEATDAIYCIDEDRTRYIGGTDFKFAGKEIIWNWTEKPATGKAPGPGTRYTIKYRAYIEWLAFVPPVERIEHGQDLGNKVLLRKKHLVEQR